MKKLLCLILSVVMTLSCFGICMTATAADYLFRPEEVSRVIDPIIAGLNTAFANSIADIGYDSTDAKITKEAFEARIKAYNTSNATFFPADDKMFGVNLDFLYNIDTNAFTWDFCKYELVVNPEVHQNEIDTAEANKKKSTCQAKGWYDACSAVLNGYEYDYETKSYDKQIFENIIEMKENIFNESTRRNEAHYRYYFFFEQGQFSLMRSNSNYLLNKLLKGSINSEKLLDAKVVNANAVKLANFIGNLLYVDFNEIPADSKVVDDIKKLTTETFFRRVAELSGLDDILQANWCNTTAFNVKDIMSALGVVVKDDVILEVELNKGNYMGGRILADMYASFVDNPLGYISKLVQLFCRNYTSLYSEAIESLFIMKFPDIVDRSRRAGDTVDSYTGNELQNVDGFFNFIADCIYFEKVDAGENTGNFEFAPLPVTRIANAKDIDELYLYLLCYMDINKVYENNASLIDSFITNTEAFFNNNYAGEKKSEDIANMKTIFGDIFQGKLSTPLIQSFYLNLITTDVIESFPDNFSSNIKRALANLLQNFITAMDNFFNVLFGWTDGLFDKNK